ncbi:MAG TPA: hypothetical protein VLZ12_01385, partial [Verrucomicrobiae bacterium]|nr:hypothetical protein [Verrucomicrobiae bacterium]
PARAQGSSRIYGRAEFRQTTEPSQFSPPTSGSARGPVGDLLVVEDGTQQTFQVKIKRLTEPNQSIQLSTNSFFDATNSPVSYVAPVNRTDTKNGNWSQKLIGTNGAPDQFQFLGVANLSDMSGINSIDIGSPGTTNIVGGTNFIDVVCNQSNGITVCTSTTNIIGGATNIYVNAFVWAPVPPLLANPSAAKFKTKVSMVQPPIPPSPKASGKILFSYKGSSGQSVLDIHVSNLAQGQTYALWLSDAGTNVNSGTFTLTSGGSDGKYRRDTKRGEPLPLQAGSTADLTGRVFTVQDGFGAVHLLWPPPP